jgi:hypothetical protein
MYIIYAYFEPDGISRGRQFSLPEESTLWLDIITSPHKNTAYLPAMGVVRRDPNISFPNFARALVKSRLRPRDTLHIAFPRPPPIFRGISRLNVPRIHSLPRFARCTRSIIQ